MRTSSEIFLENLHAEMERMGWDYAGLAKAATGITRSGIYKIAKGQRSPNTGNLDRIAKAFGRTVAWLFTDHSLPENQPTPEEALDVLKRAISATTPPAPEVPADIAAMLSRITEADFSALKGALLAIELRRKSSPSPSPKAGKSSPKER